MPNLLVRNIDPALIQALKTRAGANGRSAEAEHRDILAVALSRPPKRSLAELLAAMPNVGLDSDFERIDAPSDAPNVFD